MKIWVIGSIVGWGSGIYISTDVSYVLSKSEHSDGLLQKRHS